MEKINLFLIDSKELTQKLCELFEQHDFSMDIMGTATTHEEALEKMKQCNTIDIILTSVMNQANIHAYQKQFSKAKILLVPNRRDKYTTIQADAVLPKPFTMKALLETLQPLVKKEEETERVMDQQFKALSDGTRRKILDYLQEKTHTAGELAERCHSTKPNISQHLKVLKSSGLVQEEKKGLYVYYSLSKFEFQQTKKGVENVLNIKEKILYDIQQLAYKKNCEPVVGATDSQDDGTFYVMQDSETLISFHYSFRLSSFFVNFEIPVHLQKGGNYHIRYDDQKAIDGLYENITEELNHHVFNKEKQKEVYGKIRYALKKYIIEKTRNMNLFLTKDEKMLTQLDEWMNNFVELNYAELSNTNEIQVIKNELRSELVSLGKIHTLLEDPNVAEILINAPDDVWIEQQGKLIKTGITFADHDEVMHLARKIAGHSGRRVDNSCPILNTKLPDGSKVQIILPPIAVRGITIIVQKFFQEKLTMNDLIRFNTMSEEMVRFLEQAVASKANILVSGATGVGKTTSLNILSQLIPNHERIVTLEDHTELQLSQDHVVKLETRPANAEGVGEISLRDCLNAASKLRPDRFVIGEIRDGIAFDIIQAILTGHNGTMTAIHADTTLAALERVQHYITCAGYDYPIDTIQQWIGEAFDLVVQVTRLKDGSRKISEIAQVVGYDRSLKKMILLPLFKWAEEGKENGHITGEFVYTGYDLSDKLIEKFDQMNLPHPFEAFSKTGTEKEIEEMEKALPLFIDNVADALRSGFTLNEAFRYLHEHEKTKLTEYFYGVVKDTEAGMERTKAFEQLKEQSTSPQLTFLLHAMSMQEALGAPMELLLRHMGEMMQERNSLLRGYTKEQKETYCASDDWQWMEFLDLLACIAPTSGSLVNAIDNVHTYVNNRFSTEFKQAIEEIRAGKQSKSAFTDTSIRLNNENVHRFVLKINQAEAFGSGMERTIIEQANKWRANMKEK